MISLKTLGVAFGLAISTASFAAAPCCADRACCKEGADCCKDKDGQKPDCCKDRQSDNMKHGDHMDHMDHDMQKPK